MTPNPTDSALEEGAVTRRPGFLDLLAQQIVAAEQAAEANDLLGRTDLAESWRRRVEHLRLYLESALLQQTEPSPGLG